MFPHFDQSEYAVALKNAYRQFPAKDSTLDIDFINNRNRVAGVYGAALDGVTFTRSTTGTYFGADGLLKTAAINEPRFEYDPVSLKPLGLLIEEQRANLIPRSTSIATWEKSPLIIISDNDSTGIDGALSATKITNYDGIISLIAIDFSVPASGTNDYYATVYAKQGNSAGFTLNVYYNGNQEDNVAFDFTTGYVSGAPYPGEYIFESVGNGWFRCGYRITRDASGTQTTLSFRIWETIRGLGAIGNYLHVMAPQLEAGAFPTNYIPTTSASVTRGADVASMTGANFSSWYNQSSGTFVLRVNHPLLAREQFIVNVKDSGLYNYIKIYKNPVNVPTIASDNSTTPVFTANAELTRNTNTLVASYRAGRGNLAVNGSIGEDTAVAPPSAVNSMFLGQYSPGVGSIDGYIERMTYFPTFLPDNIRAYLSRPS